jgi:hypothetical protein
VGESFRGEQ